MRRFLLATTCAWAVLVLFAPAAVAAGEPVVSTGNATAITPTSATLNGTLNPEGQATTYYFEYGPTTSYGSQTTTAAGGGSATAGVKVLAPIAALTPNTTYHYRLVATNASGTVLGSDVSFKTPKPPAPVVVTGRATAVTQTTATLTGTVDPKGPTTSYFFQYGTSTAYGTQTPAGSAGPGSETVAVSAAIGPLAPNTTYHYRLVASSANGTTHGPDASFKTGTVPGLLTLAALPDPITFGELTSLSGRVLPPRPSHAAVTLQRAPSAGGPWTDAANTTATSTGAYSFSNLAPSANTYYRVLSDGATSATVLVSVHFRVGLTVSRRHPPAGSLVRFDGHVAPADRGHLVLIQRLGPRGHWHTIRFTRVRGFGFYSAKVRITRSGRYRVVSPPDAGHAAGVSPAVRIRVR
jgi:hypothetical protein